MISYQSADLAIGRQIQVHAVIPNVKFTVMILFYDYKYAVDICLIR